jgi:hypothetical protein
MTTRLRPTPIGVEEEVMHAKKQAEEAEEEEEERVSSVEQYVRLVCTSLPEGYWPMVRIKGAVGACVRACVRGCTRAACECGCKS